LANGGKRQERRNWADLARCRGRLGRSDGVADGPSADGGVKQRKWHTILSLGKGKMRGKLLDSTEGQAPRTLGCFENRFGRLTNGWHVQALSTRDRAQVWDASSDRSGNWRVACIARPSNYELTARIHPPPFDLSAPSWPIQFLGQSWFTFRLEPADSLIFSWLLYRSSFCRIYP
jgi:hypothetical protein